jgi:large subunit ribosomal protein L9
MKVMMLQDVENVGMAGSVVKVTDGYALNFLIPRKLAVKATDKCLLHHKASVKKQAVEKKVLGSKAAMLAERISNLHLTLKERVHNNDKLYGAVGADEIVELLKTKNIAVNRKQIEFVKTIKSVGEHNVTVKISSKLKPAFTLKVVAGEE